MVRTGVRSSPRNVHARKKRPDFGKRRLLTFLKIMEWGYKKGLGTFAMHEIKSWAPIHRTAFPTSNKILHMAAVCCLC